MIKDPTVLVHSPRLPNESPRPFSKRSANAKSEASFTEQSRVNRAALTAPIPNPYVIVSGNGWGHPKIELCTVKSIRPFNVGRQRPCFDEYGH